MPYDGCCSLFHALVATGLVFTLFWIVPGDPALTILAVGKATAVGLPRTAAAIAAGAGSRPANIRSVRELAVECAPGDLGTSLWYRPRCGLS